MTLRQNASIYATEAQAKRFEVVLLGDPDVDHFSTYVGRGAIRFILTLDVQLANPFFAQFVIVTKSLEARERVQQKLEQVLAEQFPDVVAGVNPLELGPPVGWPLQYRITGPDKDEVRRTRASVRRCAGLRLARAPRSLRLDGARAAGPGQASTRTRRAGSASAREDWHRCSTPRSPGRRSRNCATTSISSTWWRALPTTSALRSRRLSSLQVPTPSGRMVPLRQFATFAEDQEFPLVWRRNRVPTLTVRADVTPGVLPDSVVGVLAPEGRRVHTRSCRGPTRSRPAACTKTAPRRATRCSRSCRS